MSRALLLVAAAALGGGCFRNEDARRWPGDDLPACAAAPTTRAYRIDAITLPTTDLERERLGADLDGDGLVENQGGYVLAAATNQLEVDLQAEVDETLAADALHIGVSVTECAEPAWSLVELHRGVALDRVSEPPVLLAEPVTSYAAVAGELPGAAVDGWARLPLGALIHPSEQAWLDAPRVVVEVDEVSDDELAGRLAVAFDGTAAFDAVCRAFHAVVQDRIAELSDCTPRDCDPVLQTLLGLFDLDEDGDVSLEEVRTNNLAVTLLNPDVDGGPRWDPSPGGRNELLSVGVGFRARRVELFSRVGSGSP